MNAEFKEQKGRGVTDLEGILELPPLKALDLLLEKAIKRSASDFFLLANENHYVVAIRELGTIRQLVVLPRESGIQMAQAIKSQASMDLTERRHPLDGRWSHEIGGVPIDFRVNSVGTLHGEDLAMRILTRGYKTKSLEQLGFVGNQLAALKSILNRGSGLLLVTGPTGAGKSTTLYSCLDHLNDGKRMICTLEDPIENVMAGIRQSQVQPKIGLGFLELLRGLLRQSPDVIMIGEIRDEETARTAVRAANSGHLVLTTLHSPLAANAVQSMLAYGVEPYFLSSSLIGIVAQRLIRELSPDTRRPFDVSQSPATFDEVRSFLAEGEGETIYGPDPDDPDSHEGYVSQTGLFEVLTVTRTVKELISQSADVMEIHREALRQGMLDFKRAALIKIAKGQTSVEESSRAVPTSEIEEA